MSLTWLLVSSLVFVCLYCVVFRLLVVCLGDWFGVIVIIVPWMFVLLLAVICCLIWLFGVLIYFGWVFSCFFVL